jgi:putative transposase
LKFALAHVEDQSMKRIRFTEEQIIGILKEHEAGVMRSLHSDFA